MRMPMDGYFEAGLRPLDWLRPSTVRPTGVEPSGDETEGLLRLGWSTVEDAVVCSYLAIAASARGARFIGGFELRP